MPAGPLKPYSKAIADRICEQLADGKSLSEICKAEGIPSRAVVYKWLDQNESFKDDYARARDYQADSHADDVVAVSRDEKLPPDEKRVRMDALRWSAGKMKPKKYGDKTIHAGDNESPIQVESVVQYMIPNNGRDPAPE